MGSVGDAGRFGMGGIGAGVAGFGSDGGGVAGFGSTGTGCVGTTGWVGRGGVG